MKMHILLTKHTILKYRLEKLKVENQIGTILHQFLHSLP